MEAQLIICSYTALRLFKIPPERLIYTYKICGIRIKKVKSLSLSDYTMPPPNTLHSHSTPCLYGTRRALTSLIKNAHSCLSTTIFRHCLNFISRRSFSISFNHLKRGLPNSLSSFRFTPKYFLIYPSTIHSYEIFYPLQSCLFTICYYVYSLCSSRNSDYFFSPHSLFYHSSIYPPSNFPLSCIFTQKLEGPRRRGRPRKGWREEVERDLQVMGVRNGESW